MKRECLYNFDFACNMALEEPMFVPLECPAEPEDVKTPQDSLLKLIYAKDPVTRLPTGDLNYLVSDKANPQVKQYILDNLMMDVSSSAAPTIPEGLDDSLAFDLARQPTETLEQYVNRLNDFSEKNQELVRNAQRSVQSSDGSSSVAVE